MSYNKAMIMGNIGTMGDVEEVNGSKVLKFSVATNETWKDKEGAKREKVTWHNVVVWGARAEVIKQWFPVGKEIFVEGSIDNRTYEDKEGVKKFYSEIKLANFSFTGNKSKDASTENQAPDKAPEPEKVTTSVNEDDLPF